MWNGKGLSIHSPAKEETINQSSTKGEKVNQNHRQRESIGCKCAYCKSSFKDYFRNAITVWNFQEHSLESKEEPWARWTIHNAHERHSYTQTESPVRKDKHKIIAAKFRKSKIQRQMSISESDPDWHQKRRHLNAPPYDQRSKEWNERQEEFARHKAHKLHEALFKIKRHTTKMSTEQTSFLSYVPTKVKNTTTVSVIQSKERTACGFVVSDTRALNLVLLLRGLQEKLRPHSCSYQTEGCTIHWVVASYRRLWARKKKWRTPCCLC